MNFQLVIQIKDENLDFDYILKIEKSIDQILGHDKVDGHDIGISEANIFILTDNPEADFKKIIKSLDNNLLSNLKVAFRKINESKYKILFPKSLNIFKVS